jgi:hypothetical protein
MYKFYVGQQVKIGPGADNAVGCNGRIISVGLGVCEVAVEHPTGTFSGAFFAVDLIPTEEGVTV